MKITIDTVNKTIEVHESGTLAEIIEFLELSKIDMKEYKFVQKQETVFIPYHTYPVKYLEPKFCDYTDHEFKFDHLYSPGLVTYCTTNNHMQF